MTCEQKLMWRFLAKVQIAESHCWQWTASRDGCGYGLFQLPRNRQPQRTISAHRFAYIAFIGAIPDGLELDHLCRNRGCCNPAHLELVTHLENVRRGRSHQREKTHCINGHPFDVANTYARPSGGRACRFCQRNYQREYITRRLDA